MCVRQAQVVGLLDERARTRGPRMSTSDHLGKRASGPRVISASGRKQDRFVTSCVTMNTVLRPRSTCGSARPGSGRGERVDLGERLVEQVRTLGAVENARASTRPAWRIPPERLPGACRSAPDSPTMST